MKHCQMCYSNLKTIVYEGSNKKFCKLNGYNIELTNMEDIIPIFIFVILMSDISDIKAEFDMIIDFIEFDNCDLESEKRLMLNFSVTILYYPRSLSILFSEIGKSDSFIFTYFISNIHTKLYLTHTKHNQHLVRCEYEKSEYAITFKK